MANFPAASVAVKPVTPVDEIVCPVCVPPFPLVYAITLDTPFAGVFSVKVPLLVAVPQSIVWIDPCVG